MDESENDLQTNDTDRSRSAIPYFIPRRPRVIKMRDLSPDTRDLLTREYFDAYDPWTGIRIAATLGVLISLFTLFLIYKSRFHKARNNQLPPKQNTSLYLYDEDLGSSLSSAYGLSFAYKNDERFRFEDVQLEEVYVKPSVVALKVKRSSKGGPKFGTLRITEDAPRSLPCSPYKPETATKNTEVKAPASPNTSTGPTSLVGSITSFGSLDNATDADKHPHKLAKDPGGGGSKTVGKKKSHHHHPGDPGKTCAKSVVVTAKKPQDYRSRSTIVSIARRQRTS